MIFKIVNMKKILALMMLAAGLTCQAQSLDGSWVGTLEAGAQKMTIQAKVNQAQQEVKATIAELGASEQALSVNYLSDDSINVAFPQLDITYQGKREGDVVKGTFEQHGIRLPLNMKRGEQTYNRPQEPTKPYPYQTEDVTFSNKQAGVTLRRLQDWQ